jgi:hypothetical protein
MAGMLRAQGEARPEESKPEPENVVVFDAAELRARFGGVAKKGRDDASTPGGVTT